MRPEATLGWMDEVNEAAEFEKGSEVEHPDVE